MNANTARTAILGLILAGTLLGGCSTCGSPWGNAPAAYPSGYGPAAGAMTVSPPANTLQPQSTSPGWRASSGGALAPSGAPSAAP